MEREIASLQSTARLILAEAFERAIELSCAEETEVVREVRFYMWSVAFEALREGADLEYGE
jgi:hypothetical protein